MFETTSKDRRKCLLWLTVFAAVLSPIYLSISCSISTKTPMTTLSVDEEPNNSVEQDSLTDIEQRARDVALRSATRTATTGFRPSLEMKENVDFLLTPSILMQEALSEDIIITYPSE